MTYKEFEQTVKEKTGFDKYWYYGLCFIIIALSLVLFFSIITLPERFRGNHVLHYTGFAFLLFLGTYGLFKLPNRYKIISIDTLQSLAKKRTAIETLLSQMNVPKELNDNFCSFTYTRSFWSSPYDIYLFYDEKNVCFSIQGQDSFDGGFIDFGGTEKLRKKIMKDIETYLL